MKILKLTGLMTYATTLFDGIIIHKGDTVSVSDEHAEVLHAASESAPLDENGEPAKSWFTEVEGAVKVTHNALMDEVVEVRTRTAKVLNQVRAKVDFATEDADLGDESNPVPSQRVSRKAAPAAE